MTQEAGPATVAPDAAPGAPATGDGARRVLVDGRLAGSGRTFASINPATGDVVGHAVDASPGQAREAVAAARRAFDTTSWATDRELRIRGLEQLHAALGEHREELRELTIAETGSPRILTYATQLDDPIE